MLCKGDEGVFQGQLWFFPPVPYPFLFLFLCRVCFTHDVDAINAHRLSSLPPLLPPPVPPSLADNRPARAEKHRCLSPCT